MKLFIAEGLLIDVARKEDMRRARIKEETGEEPGGTSFIEGIVESYRTKETWKGNTFMEIRVSDGVETARVNIWGDDISGMGSNDPKMITKGACLRMNVKWVDKYQSFSVVSRSLIKELQRNPDADRD